MLWALAALFSILLLSVFIYRSEVSSSKKESVGVGIAPLAYLVKGITGDQPVIALPAGKGEETYDPSPKQIALLSGVQIYFYLGLPFEDRLRNRIITRNKNISSVDLRSGLSLLSNPGCDHCADHGADPHVWMSVRNMGLMAKEMGETFEKLYPQKTWAPRISAMVAELKALDERTTRTLKPYAGRAFLTAHPSFGYFAHDYGLEQISIEQPGKTVFPDKLGAICREKNIRVVFVEPQFDQKTARMIAESIGGEVIIIDPMDEDYPAMIDYFTKQLAHAFSHVDNPRH
jgi:zinc transport system substrate-binding protein